MKLLNTLLASLVLFLSLGLSVASFADDEVVENFSFKDIKGHTHQFSEYKGKWVLVNYWGTYCPPCLEEIPDLVSFADRHKENVVVLGLDAGGTNVKDLQEFAAENMMEYVIAPVQESTLTAFGILMGIPTTYVITPEGYIAAKVIGIIDLDEVEQMIDQYAKEKTGNKTSGKSGSSIAVTEETEDILDL